MATAQTKTPQRKTPLETLLNEDQVQRFMQYLIQRGTSVYSSLEAWRQKRKIYALQMDDDFSWRGIAADDRHLNDYGAGDSYYYSGGFGGPGIDHLRRALENDIFTKQNDSLNVVGGFQAFMTARTVDDLFGTDPFFALAPEGVEDAELADVMQKHSEWKLRKSNWKQTHIEAIDTAYGLGEAVVKNTWDRQIDVYEERAEVLCAPDKSPLVHPVTLEYITRNDVTEAVAPDAAGFPVAVYALRDIPTEIYFANEVQWIEMEIERTNVFCENVKAHVVHYADLMVPNNATCIQEADFVGQKCQMRLNELANWLSLDEETISLLKTDPNEPQTEEAKPIEHLREDQENEPPQDELNPLVGFVEAWVRYDPVGDGRTRRIYVLYSELHQKILKMDYMANVTPDGELPFKVIRAYPVKNRWYGRGFFEIYAAAQEYIDRQFSNVSYRNRFNSNPMVFFKPQALVSTGDNMTLEVKPGQTYELLPQYTVKDAFDVFIIPDLDQRTWDLMQMMIQMIQVRSGVTSAAQGEVSSLPSTSTATGIESILQSATTLARMPMNCIKNSMERSLLYALKLIYTNASIDETYSYFEGDVQKVGTLEIDDVRDIDINVRLLLTRFKERENLEQASEAMKIHMQYISLPEEEKEFARPLYVQALAALGIDQADTIIRLPMLPEPLPAPGQPALGGEVIEETGQPPMANVTPFA